MSWICSFCSSPQRANDYYCTACLYSRPLDRKGIPQIFAGFCFHFNGIIPQVLKHPSHAVEWRMAERHGAVCSVSFDESVNLLVYRPGYERSDKCRYCVGSRKVNAVPISWMLDSLLETRQINISFYRLTAIPDFAKITTVGSNLPHYEHPFFLLKGREYSIPTSFPMSMQDKLNNSRTITSPSKSISNLHLSHNSAVPGFKKNISYPSDDSNPPFFEIPALKLGMIDVYESALGILNKKKTKVNGHSNATDFLGDMKEQRGVEIIAATQHHGKVDTMLFSGMIMMLTTSLLQDPCLQEVLRQCGAKILSYSENPTTLLTNNVTHVIYHRSDKKGDFLIEAAHVKATKRPGLLLCDSIWLEDCLMLSEIIPPCGMYNPSATLLETLKKRREKKKI